MFKPNEIPKNIKAKSGPAIKKPKTTKIKLDDGEESVKGVKVTV